MTRTAYGRRVHSSLTLNPWVIFVSEAGDTEFTGRLRGTAGRKVRINWGDGNTEWLTFSGTGTDDNISHDYGTTGNFIISLTGDLADLTKIKYAGQKLSKFYLPSTNLPVVNLGNTSVTGTIADLKELTNLTVVSLYNTSVTGTIADLKELTNLTYLSIGLTSVTGTTADLKELTNLTYLGFEKANITGDIGELRTLTSLTTLYAFSLSDISYSQGALPDSWKNINVSNNGWSSEEVDNFIIDLDTPGRVENGTLDIAGNNAPRTSASDEAKQHLIDKGWTITVNE